MTQKNSSSFLGRVFGALLVHATVWGIICMALFTAISVVDAGEKKSIISQSVLERTERNAKRIADIESKHSSGRFSFNGSKDLNAYDFFKKVKADKTAVLQTKTSKEKNRLSTVNENDIVTALSPATLSAIAELLTPVESESESTTSESTTSLTKSLMISATAAKKLKKDGAALTLEPKQYVVPRKAVSTAATAEQKTLTPVSKSKAPAVAPSRGNLDPHVTYLQTDTGTAGGIKLGETDFCTAEVSGTIRYNYTTGAVELCNQNGVWQRA